MKAGAISRIRSIMGRQRNFPDIESVQDDMDAEFYKTHKPRGDKKYKGKRINCKGKKGVQHEFEEHSSSFTFMLHKWNHDLEEKTVTTTWGVCKKCGKKEYTKLGWDA